MLQDAIESDRALSPDQKQEALEAVATLAKEGSKPPEQAYNQILQNGCQCAQGLGKHRYRCQQACRGNENTIADIDQNLGALIVFC